jgi:hypothetical protein
MEFRRRVLLRLAEFCIQLQLPAVRTADDLLADWGNHFGDRDSKIALMLCRQLIPTGLDTKSPTTKAAVFRHVASLLLELEAKLTRGTTESPDSGHRCQRAVPNLSTKATHPEDILRDLIHFAKGIQDTARCRANCRIDRFLEGNQPLVERWIAESETVRGDARQGMRETAPDARSAMDRGLETWTCKDCEKLGDWVITLDCPGYLQVEHTDHIYDHLCPSRSLSHRKHRPDRLDLKPPPAGKGDPPQSE